ncbi:hypothetical protein AMBR_NBBOBCOC_02842 [Lacticaseibacillus rhamnosus]|nr:hypothetical protein AMBR_NBBOBCOC_02842 [Lacticaseibacillus rhamnosus]
MCFVFFFFKQKTAYVIPLRLVGSEMCIRDSFLIGGEQKLLGRSGLRKEKQPYSLTVQLAYQDKTPAAPLNCMAASPCANPVSYTHLTLPTIPLL